MVSLIYKKYRALRWFPIILLPLVFILAHRLFAIENDPKQQIRSECQQAINRTKKLTVASKEKAFLDSKKIKAEISNKPPEKHFNYDFGNFVVKVLTLGVLSFTLYWVFRYTKVAQAELARKEIPKVNYSVQQIWASLDTWIVLKNMSDQSVSVTVNCNIKLDNKRIDFSDDYNGKRYWNMGPWEEKIGHFSFVTLFRESDIIPKNRIEKIENQEMKIIKTGGEKLKSKGNQDTCELLKKLFGNNDVSGEPRQSLQLIMDIVISVMNQEGKTFSFPPRTYRYDSKNRMIWVPVLTSDKPVFGNAIKQW
jgi:hypothetical protein